MKAQSFKPVLLLCLSERQAFRYAKPPTIPNERKLCLHKAMVIMMVSYQSLRWKEVICVSDASTVGVVTDLIFDECSARVCSLCVTPLGFCNPFAKKHAKRGGSVTVPWEKIVRMGENCILVDLKCK